MSDNTQYDRNLAAWAESSEFEQEVSAGRVAVSTGEAARTAGRDLIERLDLQEQQR